MISAAAAIFVRGQTTVMERRDTRFFSVSEAQRGAVEVVRISGTSATSHMSVKNISERKSNLSIIVLVHIFLARSGTSGSFVYDVVVPTGVNEIRYGNDGDIVWRRNAST